MNIAFFGVGNMGGPMAANLIQAGHTVRVFDLLPALVEAAVASGATAAASPREAVTGAEVVISMLPSAAAAQGLYLGDGAADAGILDAIDPAALIVDCSTIDAATSRALAARADELGRVLIDAPVSGGVGGARAGTLTFICGGPAEAVERARPLLETMGRNVFHAGDSGAGQTAKICNNMLLGILMAGTAEALQLGVDNGLDPAVLSAIMAESSGSNWALKVYNPWPGVMPEAPASHDYQGGFGVALMNKDLRLAQEAALRSRSTTPLGALAKSLYGFHAAAGGEGYDFSSIQRFYARGHEPSGQA
ncbi:3-hydroxyisobutyrate dehydrogenase [Salinicola sp. RZ23]|uniref:3-hydroxyisobutyrate dehydrogenase n=1 Tax=Salinicola sp. RZ23 TaxID=1949087 RepID=UPI000DA2363C|nr:3-hydroxyisobutyrate dehydrogenase [Salinicola sp. RZ23]